MIISDPHFAINISPFTIYLIDRHGKLNPEYVERLNNDSELTGTVFRFEHFLCSPGQLGKNFMSHKYSYYLERCNVLVRLFPSQTEIFYFQIDTFTFRCSYEYFRYQASVFIASITYQNDKNAALYWSKLSFGHINGFHLHSLFCSFLKDHSNYLRNSNEKFILEKAFPKDADLLQKLSERKRVQRAHLDKMLIDEIVDLFELPDNDESNKLFSDVLSGTARSSILTEYHLIQPKDENIDVSVEISYIGHSTGGEKPQYQFTCFIDEIGFPVYMGQITSAVIYLYVLLFAKAGKKIYRDNLRQNCGKLDLPPYLEILKEAYNIFLYGVKRDDYLSFQNNRDDDNFKMWINKINNNNSRNLNQGKSNINSLLGKELSKYCQYDEGSCTAKGSCLDCQNYTMMSALPSLKVENYKHKRSTTTYGISLSEDKIIVPEEFMPIVEKIKEFDFDRVFG